MTVDVSDLKLSAVVVELCQQTSHCLSFAQVCGGPGGHA